MNLITFLLPLLFVIVLILLMFGGYILYSMFMPTRGERIGFYTEPTSALLVLDIQESGNIKKTVPFPSGSPFGNMIEKVNLLIDGFNSKNNQIAYIRQVFSNNLITRLHGGRILEGRMEPVVCRWVNVVNKNDFVKNRTDAFSNRNLERFLIEHQVDHVYLVGLDAAFCVYYTALGALNRGYKVTVVSDAVMTKKDLSPVLQKYRDKGVDVVTAAEVIETFDAR